MLDEETNKSKSGNRMTHAEGYPENEAAKIVQLQKKQIEGLRQEIELARARLGIKVGAGAISKERAQYA